MMVLIQDVDEWENYVIYNINKLFIEYYDFIDIKCLGFPEDWHSLLTKRDEVFVEAGTTY